MIRVCILEWPYLVGGGNRVVNVDSEARICSTLESRWNFIAMITVPEADTYPGMDTFEGFPVPEPVTLI